MAHQDFPDFGGARDLGDFALRPVLAAQNRADVERGGDPLGVGLPSVSDLTSLLPEDGWDW